MPADNELWLPPLSPKDQKKIDRHQKYQGLMKWTGFPEKTLWDWLQLLSVLAIPVLIAAGTLWFTAQQSETSSQASNKQHQTDIQIAQDQQQENAFQMYLDQMSDLLLNSKLRESQPEDEVCNVARARTLTTLSQLNGERKGALVHFLYEAGLISQKKLIVNLSSADLSNANLSSANLIGATLSGANLSNAIFSNASLTSTDLSGTDLSNANFSDAYSSVGANLSTANLWKTNFSGAGLSNANLSFTNLSDANFWGADLRGANFSDAYSSAAADLANANLSDAILNRAILSNADLSGVSLNNADFSDANLNNAKVTQEQLNQAKSLKGTTMPDGSKHP